MKIVLFDLGDTLEHNDVLMPGAREALEAISGMQDAAGDPAILAVISDFDMPERPEQVPEIRERYLRILSDLGIRRFFEPPAERVTLSTEVGEFKPKRRVFRAAVDKVDPSLGFDAVIFITENGGHVAAARRLGMEAVHFQGLGQTTGQIRRLIDLPPLVQDWLAVPTAPRPRGRTAPSAGTVKVALSRAPDETHALTEVLRSAPAVSQARLGEELLLFAPDADWSAISARAADGGMPVEELRENVERERLHLVVQKGDLFQRAHPEVPVLLERGRFLVVELDPEEADRLVHEGEPCYTLRSLEDDPVIFETQARDTARAAPVPWIQDLVAQLERASYLEDLTTLASLRTRLSTGPEFLQAAEWARGRLSEMGYTVEEMAIRVGAGTSRNVIAERPGGGPMPGVVLVTAHLDSINQAGPTAPAPGADDNASGSAGVLQMARVFRAHAGIHDLRFILFGGEEEGLLGSSQYVADLSAAERRRIRAVVNMDMIGTLNAPPPGALLEGKALSQTVIDGLADAAATYTGLRVQTSLNAADSDHVSFLRAMIPAVLTIEGADRTNHNIHSDRDTLDHVDSALALEILRMNVAFVAATVGRVT